MTLEEKVAQMTCVWNDKDTTLIDPETGLFDPDKAREAFGHGNGIGQVGRPSDAGGTLEDPSLGRGPREQGLEVSAARVLRDRDAERAQGGRLGGRPSLVAPAPRQVEGEEPTQQQREKRGHLDHVILLHPLRGEVSRGGSPLEQAVPDQEQERQDGATSRPSVGSRSGQIRRHLRTRRDAGIAARGDRV